MINSGQQQRICILGSTGSIGVSTLDVISRNPDVSVYALTAHHNHQLMLTQCLAFSPRYAVMADEVTAAELTRNLRRLGSRTEVLFGPQALCDVWATFY